LIDGVRLSGAKSFRFAHNDLQHLQQRLEKAQSLGVRNKLICVDAVFSMDGDTAPLAELAALAQRYDAVLMADDAHGFGVLGAKGAGLCEQLDLAQDNVPILMATLGKAMGSAGALVAGSNLLIESLVQFARPYIYTTSMPPAVAAASRQSLRLLQQEPWRKAHLAELITYFQLQAQSLALPIMPSNTAIQPLLIGDEALAMQCQQALYEQGFWISAIRTPTVAIGMARLRITLTANHSRDDIDRLLLALQQLPFARKACS
jgi:8-amino-7-oxononanoate synthase